MNTNHIEQLARELQLRIWAQRAVIWPGETELRVADVLDPAVAASVLGIDFELREELRWFNRPCVALEETAGILDREENRILISRRFPPGTMRFTGAHELGHWFLHRGLTMHRDRPLQGLGIERTPRAAEEVEADHFAACFLVPRRRLIAALEAAFQIKAPFVVNDRTAFYLRPSDPDSILTASQDSFESALAVAGAISYAGRPINSLASQFAVSVTTLAIRLRELGLIED